MTEPLSPDELEREAVLYRRSIVARARWPYDSLVHVEDDEVTLQEPLR